MSAWGRTGRVVLDPACRDVDFVDVDGNYAGSVLTVMRGGYMVSLGHGWIRGIHLLPSRDAAVLWVLRRVDPALWRQERGAWLVRKRKPGEGIADGWFFRGPREFNPLYPWLIVDPNGVSRDAAVDIFTANRYAAQYAANPKAVSV